MDTQTIEFSALSENVTLVEKLIDKICSEFKINEDHYGNILVTLTEAVNNAIHHGNNSDPDKMVFVTFKALENELFFTVRDQGVGFDFDNLADPTDPENIEKPHGRGVFLMKHLSDAIEFKDNGTTVDIKFKLVN
ncbi:MAG: ATP-binding protein [Bacteroidota bacterium]|nr:ATP-binding protein [Bacteroidota bacterium]